MTPSGRTRRRSISVLTLLACGLSAGHAVAQGYVALAPPVDAKQAKLLETKVISILRDPQGPGAGTQVLDDYFTKHYFVVMTSPDPLELGNLGERRKQLFQRFMSVPKAPATRDYLNSITLKAMSAISKGVTSKGVFHPAVRYNAALVIGQLDQDPGVKPLPAATEALLTLLENEQFSKVPVPTAVKVAALVGLNRHAALGVDPAIAGRITKVAIAVATRKDPPEDASRRAYGWVRRQAATVLASQFAKGMPAPVHDAFVSMIGDDKSDLDDRCGVAGLLVPAMYEGGKDLDRDAMTLALGSLTRKVLSAEAKAADKYLDATIGGGFTPSGGEGGRGMGAMYGGRGGAFGEGGGGGGFGLEAPDLLSPHYEKRNMLKRTQALVAAANAVKSGASDELKSRLDEFVTTISAAAQLAAKDDTPEAEVADTVSNLSRDIDRMVTAWAPGAAPAGDEEEGFGPPADAATPEPAAQAQPAEAAGG